MSEYIIRYGAMRFLGVFSGNDRLDLNRGEYALLRTERGMEVGQVLCTVTSEMLKKVECELQKGQVLRKITTGDAREFTVIHQEEIKEFQKCLECIEQLKLDMHLVDIEHLFGGERVVVYYLADGRVDFRELVKILASEFQTRIEMRQIGVRDEAKLLADYGDCGREVCCNSYLTIMPPVSMKMAKLQKATLDPSKISGRCGRLKCCLRYENAVYEEILGELPPIGCRVVTPNGPGKVVGHEILMRRVYVENEEHVRQLVDVEELKMLEKRVNKDPG